MSIKATAGFKLGFKLLRHPPMFFFKFINFSVWKSYYTFLPCNLK